MTYDVTVYVPGVESLTIRDLDQKTVDEIKLQAPHEAKVTVCEHDPTIGRSRRYR